MIPLIAVKSVFLSLVQIAWAYVTFGLMGWTFVFIRTNYETVNLPEISNIMNIGINFVFDNVSLIFWILTIIYFYFEYMELRKFAKTEQEVKE